MRRVADAAAEAADRESSVYGRTILERLADAVHTRRHTTRESEPTPRYGPLTTAIVAVAV